MFQTHTRILLTIILMVMLTAAALSAKINYDDDEIDIEKPVVLDVDLSKVTREEWLHNIYAVGVFALPGYAYMNHDILRFYTQQNGVYTRVGGPEAGAGGAYTIETLDFQVLTLGFSAPLYWQSGQTAATDHASVMFFTINGLAEADVIWRFDTGTDIAALLGWKSEVYRLDGSFLREGALWFYGSSLMTGGDVSQAVGPLRLRLKLGLTVSPPSLTQNLSDTIGEIFGLHSEFGVGVRFSTQ